MKKEHHPLVKTWLINEWEITVSPGRELLQTPVAWEVCLKKTREAQQGLSVALYSAISLEVCEMEWNRERNLSM